MAGDNMHEHKHCKHEHKEEHGQGYKGIGESERRKIMDPEVLLPKIGLKSGMTFVDVGCGQGYFAIPAARIVGPEGHVYGIDIDKEALDLLGRTASNAGLKIRIIQSEAETNVACEGCADIVFFGISLHDFGEPEKVLENSWRMLKPGGILADLDGRKAGSEDGHPRNGLSEEKALKLITEANFNIVSVESISDWLYLILAKK